MTTTDRQNGYTVDATGMTTVPAEETATQRGTRYIAATVRLGLGWTFLWAFLDKTFALGHETGVDAKTGAVDYFGPADWIHGGSLTAGFLGFAMRVAAVTGAAMLVMMWSAVLPHANNPFLDDHIVYALVLGLLVLIGAGRTFGFGKQWERIPVVQKHGWLK